VLLIADEVCLAQPCAKLVVYILTSIDAKRVEVVSWRKCLNAAEPWMFESARKHDVPVQPVPARCDLRERHPHLECDSRLLGQHAHRTNRSDSGDDVLKQRLDLCWLPAKVMIEGIAATRVGLIAIRERPMTIRAAPEARSVAHGTCSPEFTDSPFSSQERRLRQSCGGPGKPQDHNLFVGRRGFYPIVVSNRQRSFPEFPAESRIERRI
jgi:hypothetical protein